MEDEEKKDNNTFKDGLKKGALGFVKAIFDYIKGIVALLLILLGLSAFGIMIGVISNYISKLFTKDVKDKR